MTHEQDISAAGQNPACFSTQKATSTNQKKSPDITALNMATRVPNPAYPAKDSAVLYGDKELYARIGKIAEQNDGKNLIEEFEIPIRSGKVWVVKKGESCASFSGQLRKGDTPSADFARPNLLLIHLKDRSADFPRLMGLKLET